MTELRIKYGVPRIPIIPGQVRFCRHFVEIGDSELSV
jgi:hypothetical protein